MTVLFVLGLLLSVRLAPVVLAGAPLGDGGLFSVMARDIRAAGFALPAFTSYNDGTIPFVYPPLGLYLLALVPGDPVQTERWLPLVYSYAAVGAAFLLFRELAERRTALVAVAAFAVMPITWAIEGGGVTRGLAFALLLMTWWRVSVLVKQPTLRNGVLVGLAAGLAVLSHPAVGPAGVVTTALLLAFRFSWRAVGMMAVAGVVEVLVCLPWVVAVLSTHGPEPWVLGATAHASLSPLARLLTYGPAWLQPFDPIFSAAIIGIALYAARGNWFLPAWLALMILVPGDPRFAAPAWSLLAAVGALVVYDALRQYEAQRVAVGLTTAMLLVVATISSYQRFQVAQPTLTPTTMDDAGVEWWPVTHGPSPIVYFGYEWTDQWNARLASYRATLSR